MNEDLSSAPLEMRKLSSDAMLAAEAICVVLRAAPNDEKLSVMVSVLAAHINCPCGTCDVERLLNGVITSLSATVLKGRAGQLKLKKSALN